MTNHTIPGSWTEIGATDVTEDIKILTANYLAALKSNSDEIARLAEALRAAEAERDEALSKLSACQWSHEVQSKSADKAEAELVRVSANLNAELDAARAEL